MSIRAFDELIEHTIKAFGELPGYHPHTRGHLYNLLHKFGEAYAEMHRGHSLQTVLGRVTIIEPDEPKRAWVQALPDGTFEATDMPVDDDKPMMHADKAFIKIGDDEVEVSDVEINIVRPTVPFLAQFGVPRRVIMPEIPDPMLGEVTDDDE